MAPKIDVKKKHFEMGAALDEKTKIKILSKTFEQRVGYTPNWEDPKTMNEKIMWLKLFYQDPLITTCSDKFSVKDYVSEVVGKEYVVPTIASWTDPDDIDFDALPDQFVLKVNWSSGYNIIVKDKSQLDIDKTRNQLRRWIQPDRNSYYQFFNWGYKHMKPVIYAEEYLEQIAGQVYDYKFYFSHEEFLYMFIATDRHGVNTLTYTFFDENFQKLPCEYGHKHNADPALPANLDKMLELAKKLAKPFPYVRVDFYEIGDTIYLGEMTFYSGGGLLPFDPPEWDRTLGDKIPLPAKTIIDVETPGFKVKSALKKAQLGIKAGVAKVKAKLRKLCRKLVRKITVKGKKYIFFLGVRIPYTTHIEIYKTCRKKYISLLGVELCYKKLPPLNKKINTVAPFKYKPNAPLTNFHLEDKITPAMQRIHCEQKAYKQLGYFPNLKAPKTLNEKIIWLALNYKNPEISPATNKGTAKEWITNRVGEGHVVPLLGVYEDVNDIDFNALPDQFVAKLNDGWGADKVMIIRDKKQLNVDRTKAVLSSWLYPWNNYYYQNMCITDEKMPVPTIVIEEYLDSGKDNPDDFKFYCCNGEPKFALVVSGRGTGGQTRSFVDMEWNVLPFARKGMKIAQDVLKPEKLDEMKELCRKLSAGFPFVRIDFYEVDGTVYVGEMTFTPGMFLSFTSKAWDERLGDYLRLPIEEEITDLNELSELEDHVAPEESASAEEFAGVEESATAEEPVIEHEDDGQEDEV